MTTKRTNALASAKQARRSGAALAALATALLASSCGATGEQINDHWNFRSVQPRIERAATGYDPSRHSTYSEYSSKQWSEFSLTLKRHLLNYNPDNPFQVAPRPAKEVVWEVPPNPYE